MNLSQLSVRAKLGLLMLLAMVLLAGTRGAGLIQLGSYLDRIKSFTQAIDDAHQQIQAVQQAHIADVRAGKSGDATQKSYETRIASLQGQLESRRMDAAAVQHRERAIMHWTYVSMLVLVFVVCGAIYWLLMRLVVRPLQGVAAVADRVAAGDLTMDIVVKGKDEIGQVMQSLHDMNVSLGDLIGKIRRVSHSIGGSTAEIAAASNSLTQQVSDHTAFLQQTASSLRSLADAVSGNAESAQRAREVAASAREVAIKGGTEVSEAVDVMMRISASSRKIVDIVTIIDGITFQTNILALNAAVEAARAGEQGRGFAVVAAEVRSLAQRSAAAAKEIAGLINASVLELRRGSAQVEKAGTTMTQIVKGARAVDDIMAQLAGASTEQQRVIGEVRVALDRIDQTSEQQALLAHAVAAANSMRTQTQELIEAVSVFRLNQHDARASAEGLGRAVAVRPG